MKFGAFSSLLATLALVCSSVVDAKYTLATSANFDSLVNNAQNPVAVLFCLYSLTPCKLALSNLEKVASRTPQVTVVFVDAGKTPQLFRKYKIVRIPTFKGFYKNQAVNSYAGPMTLSIVTTIVGELVVKSL